METIICSLLALLIGVGCGGGIGYFLASYMQSKELIRLYKTSRDLEVRLLQYEEMMKEEIELGLIKLREGINNDTK